MVDVVASDEPAFGVGDDDEFTIAHDPLPLVNLRRQLRGAVDVALPPVVGEDEKVLAHDVLQIGL